MDASRYENRSPYRPAHTDWAVKKFVWRAIELNVWQEVEVGTQLPPSAGIVSSGGQAGRVATAGLALELHALTYQAGA